MESAPVVCPSCRVLLEPTLPLCPGCARVFAERDDTRSLIVRDLPADARPVVRLLAGACGLDEATLRRYLGRGPALLALPASPLVTAALVGALVDAGATVEVRQEIPAWSSWLR